VEEFQTFIPAVLCILFSRAVILSAHNVPFQMTLLIKHCQQNIFHYSETIISEFYLPALA